MKAIVTRIDDSNAGIYQLILMVMYADSFTADLEPVYFVPVGVNNETDFKNGAQIQILADALTRGYTITASDIIWAGAGNTPSLSRVFSNPSLAVNTSRQASASRDAFVSASVDITAGLNLTGGTTGKVELKYADDSAFTTNVKSVQPSSNGNTGTLTIGLALNQLATATVTGIVPAGKYYRLVTTNVTGTPTFGTPAISEVLL